MNIRGGVFDLTIFGTGGSIVEAVLMSTHNLCFGAKIRT